MQNSKRKRAPLRNQVNTLGLAMKGDREAASQLFAAYSPQLYRTAFCILRNQEEAEDALQEGLLSAFCHLREFECRSQFSTWLTRIVINTALMRLRRTRRTEMASIDDCPEPWDQTWAQAIPDHRPNPEENYARQERLEILEAAMLKMPDAYRRAISLRFQEGLLVREAAEALGVANGTFKSQLHRARLWLTEALAETRRRRPPLRRGYSPSSHLSRAGV